MVEDCRDPSFVLETDRLILRRWRDAGIPPFIRMNGDPEVMAFFPDVLDAGETRAMVTRIEDRVRVDGFSFMPVEEKARGAFVGFVGLNRPRFPQPVDFTPCVEIGWRLARDVWGRGYAREAATAWVRFAFETLRLDAVVSFAVVANKRSIAVMRGIGMRESGTFDHPAIPDQRPDLRAHVLYRLSREEWKGECRSGPERG